MMSPPLSRFGVCSSSFPWVWALMLGLTLFTPAPRANGELPLAVAKLDRTTPVDFGKELMPILKRNCLACHQKADAEGGLVLETLASIMQGGDSGATVVPEDAASSLLMTRTTGEEEPLMPPEDNNVGASPLTPDELGLLQLWIQQGASGSDHSETESIDWQPIPESMRSVYAMDVSPDGQLLAFGRGNRVVVADLTSHAEVARLVDPSLGVGPVADVDLIQSIAFSPDGTRIATGGFRTVRLWKRTRQPLSDDHEASAFAKSAKRMAIHPAQTAMAIVNAIGDVEVWDLGTGSSDGGTLRTTIGGHQEPITGIAWAGSTDRMVIAGEAGLIRVYDASGGQQLAELDLASSLNHLAASADGVHLAVVDQQRRARLLRLVFADAAKPASLEVVHESVAEITDATAIALLSKPTPAMVIASESRGVVLVDAQTNQVVRTIEVKAIVDALAVSQDESLLFSGDRDAAAKVWNVADGKLLSTGHGTPHMTLQLAQATRDAARQKALVAKLFGKTKTLEELLKKEDEALAAVVKARDQAATANDANVAKLAEAIGVVATTKAALEKANADATQAAQTIAAATAQRDTATAETPVLKTAVEARQAQQKTANEELAQREQVVASAETPTDEQRFEVEKAAAKVQWTSREVDEAKKRLKESEDSLTEANAMIAKATQAASTAKAASEKATKDLEAQQAAVAKAEAEKVKSVAELEKQQRSTDAATDAQQRATAAIPAHQSVVEAETRRLARLDQALVRVQEQMSSPGQEIVDVTCDADATRFATVHRDGSTRVYRVSDGQPIASLPAGNSIDSGLSSGVSGLGQAGPLRVALVGETIVRLGPSGSVQRWPLQEQWVLERTIGAINDPQTITDRVTALDFHRDSTMLAVGTGEASRSGTVKIFSVHTGEVLRDFEQLHTDTVLGLDFSPDGRTLASAAADKTIRLIDVTSGQTRRTLEGHTHHVLSVAWQDDGRGIASAGADQAVKVWDSETGETSRTISGFSQEMTSIAYIQSSDQIVAACGSGQVRLSNATSGATVRNFDAAKDFLFTVTLTPDAKQLIAGGQSGVVRVWNLADAAVVAEF